jgi:hypothetical protein
MAQRMMWIQVQSIYRGQATDGTVVTVEADAMDLALKKAGNGIYDSDWWNETLEKVLDHWGISTQRWHDAVTKTPRAHFDRGK